MEPGGSALDHFISSAATVMPQPSQPGGLLDSTELRLYNKELELMALEKALLSKQTALTSREADLAGQAEEIKKV